MTDQPTNEPTARERLAQMAGDLGKRMAARLEQETESAPALTDEQIKADLATCEAAAKAKVTDNNYCRVEIKWRKRARTALPQYAAALLEAREHAKRYKELYEERRDAAYQAVLRAEQAEADLQDAERQAAYETLVAGEALDKAEKVEAENIALKRQIQFLRTPGNDPNDGWCEEHEKRFQENARRGDEGLYDECQICRAEAAEAELARMQLTLDAARNQAIDAVAKAQGLEADNARLQDRLSNLRADIAERLVAKARRYMQDDGSYGDLSMVWGWREISKHLREAAREALGEKGAG